MTLQTSSLPALRQQLLQRQGELQSEIRAANDALRQARDADVHDSKDEADLQQRITGDDAQLARDLGELEEVEGALQRLAAGTYGVCAACGSTIPAARLAAQPAARLCTSCQSRLEAGR